MCVRTCAALGAALGVLLAAPSRAEGDADPAQALLRDDSRAAALAEELHARTGTVVDVLPAETMDGGFRGVLHLVPAPPVGAYRAQLAWVTSAFEAHDDFFGRLGKLARDPLPYRWRSLEVRFFRSVGGRRPSAYAEGWSIAFNVVGSLNVSADGVRETLFHEVFHLNDAAHKDWSARALAGLYEPIVARCGTRRACLAPYAPNRTVVRGGTYYAFQPGNGNTVHEYAAELAVRYYREELAALDGRPVRPAFKCGPPENARAWELIVAEFFGGVDVTPGCGT